MATAIFLNVWLLILLLSFCKAISVAVTDTLYFLIFLIEVLKNMVIGYNHCRSKNYNQATYKVISNPVNTCNIVTNGQKPKGSIKEGLRAKIYHN